MKAYVKKVSPTNQNLFRSRKEVVRNNAECLATEAYMKKKEENEEKR